MVIKVYKNEKDISENDVKNVINEIFSNYRISGCRVLIIIPDGTRTAPMPMFIRLFIEVLANQVKKLGFLIALGTHAPMSREKIKQQYGITDDSYFDCSNKVNIFNHQWNSPESIVELGRIKKEEVENISEGLLPLEMPVTINKNILDYDLIVICGPVFPHEIVGFSGGDKYFFPGISGPDVIDFTHWLAALLTSMEVIGNPHTPVRALIEKAASLIPVPRIYFNMVMSDEGLGGLFVGDNKESWLSAVNLSKQLNVIYKDHSYSKVLSVIPTLYDDLWTAAKGMYKVEPVISDGGEVIIYAPHITEVSYTHGKLLDQIGYHVRDYYTKQWEAYKDFPWSVLGHSTHLRGSGKFNLMTRKENPRIKVTLATGISEGRCKRINLNYLDPNSILPESWIDREGEGILYVPRAGEKLFQMSASK